MTFAARLAVLRRVYQEYLDERTFDPFPELPKVRVTTRLPLHFLAHILPPTEQRLLEHLQARRPLDELIGQPGFPDRRRLNRLLQRLLSRVQTYVGSTARHRLMKPYDYRRNRHRLGRRRRMIPRQELPELWLYAPINAITWKRVPGLRFVPNPEDVGMLRALGPGVLRAVTTSLRARRSRLLRGRG
jgi:hypothetical protein